MEFGSSSDGDLELAPVAGSPHLFLVVGRKRRPDCCGSPAVSVAPAYWDPVTTLVRFTVTE